MMDRLLETLLRLTVVGLISLVAFGFLVFNYQALAQLLGGQAFEAAQSVGLGLWMGLGVYLLVRYRGDLMYC